VSLLARKLASSVGQATRLTLEEYHAMIATGELGPDDRVELLRGLLVKKMSINPPHNATLRRLNRLLLSMLSEGWVVGIQGSITLPDDSEPEPDVMIAIGPESRYAERNPGPEDIALVMEVADSSIGHDANLKLSIYAAAKLPEYWLIDLVAGEVVVYTQPKGSKKPGFRGRVVYDKASEIPLVLGGKSIGSIRVAEFLP
jgi:Uma2 family endonuclease